MILGHDVPQKGFKDVIPMEMEEVDPAIDIKNGFGAVEHSMVNI